MRPLETLLEEGIRSGGCPVCHVGARSTFDLLAQIVGTIETEAGSDLLARLTTGLCNRHAWEFTDLAAASSIEALCRNLLLEVAERLEQDGVATSPPAICMVCEEIAARERAALRLLLEHLEDPARRTRYGKTRGLCMPHLSLALQDELPTDLRAFLVQQGARSSRQLAEWIREVVRKHKALLRHEITPEEQRSPVWAIAHLAGRDGIPEVF